MTTITHKFTPSINILRDVNAEFKYILTANSSLIFKQILDGFKNSGKRSFSIVGSYGTGKSSFLWALQQSLSKNKNLFTEYAHEIDQLPAFEFISLVGSFNSFTEEFGEAVSPNRETTTKQLFAALDKQYKKLEKKGLGMAIVVDEFGKFLEFAAQHNPENELYFVQQLAEFANDASRNIIFIVTLHQGLEAYSLGLDKTQRQEWDKVKGRLKELAFNEPVEQLLLLAAKRIQGNVPNQKKFNSLFKAIEQANAFPLRDYFSEEIAAQLYPFDILSAAILTLALQRYGQNERSLFLFIEGNEHLGLQTFQNQQNHFYDLALVYDYLNYNYNSLLSSKYNPHLNQWSALKNALERLEAIVDFPPEDLAAAQRLVKVIGLLGIFVPASARLDLSFLSKYAQLAMGISKELAESLLHDLDKKHKIIAYQKYKHKFTFTEGTDLDIELAIDAAGNLVEQITNVVNKLQESFSFPYILAKENYYQYGTPRFFEFKLTDEPTKEIPTGEVDGFINLIFSEQLDLDALKETSKASSEAILFGWFPNTKDIKRYLLEIEKAKKVIELHKDDKVAKRELEQIVEHYKKLVDNAVLGNLYAENSSIIWIFQGQQLSLKNRKTFHRQLSTICQTVYPKTPRLLFEMINKTKLSGAMLTARKKLLDALVENHEEQELGFDEDKFPPEKSIYLALLKRTGIHVSDGKNAYLQDPTVAGLASIWQACEDFLSSSKTQKRSLEDLMEMLLQKPFKLKEGLLEFWLPVFLFVKRDDFALFEEGRYIPQISKDILELVSKNPQKYQVKAFDVDGVRLNLFNSYRTMLEQKQELQFSNKSFIETVRPFLTFYKQLPEYSKKTNRLPKEAIALREAIAHSTDPEKAFFEDFPAALGYTSLQLQSQKDILGEYINQLQQAIRVLRNAFEDLLGRFEEYFLARLGLEGTAFETYKPQIQKRFQKVKNHLLLAHQKPFFLRINSALNDRRNWLLSIAQACLSKPLEQLTDAEEPLLFDRLQTFIHELDNLNEISSKDIDQEKEVFFKLKVSSIVEGFKDQSDSIRLPKTKVKEIEKIEADVKKLLTKDHELNIAVLARLLQEQINHGKKG